MDDIILRETKNFQQNNLNFTIDNFQMTIHNFMADTFENISGYETHQHSSYELHYIKKGQGNVIIHDDKFEIGPGDLYILAPYTPHSQEVYTKSMYEYALRFDIHKRSTHSTSETSELEIQSIMDLLEKTINTIHKDQYLIENIFEKAFLDMYYKYPGYYVNVKNAILEIIIATARISIKDNNNFTTYDLPKRSVELRQIEIITEFIGDNLEGNISNHLLARHVHMSERQLHRLVKKHTGLSPHQFVLEQRINKVKNLIDEKSKTLKYISEITGFSSEFHLSSAFKKLEGITPREYSKKSSDRYLTSQGEFEI